MNQHDSALLRQYEPIIHFTQGEQFFPIDVERYVQACSYWVQRPGQFPLRLKDQGEMTLAELGTPRLFPMGSVPYLKFIDPLQISEMAAFRIREGLENWGDKNRFRAGRGRLARVGYISRFVDALFSLSLLLRGRVPGDTALAAVQAFQEMLAADETYRYYGRIVRDNGWICLQYWYFYPFNNWRSGFYGANDHESDWEMVAIYLYETDAGEVSPEWVAYASHDFSGDDLRRRWDDPELHLEDGHPVIYAGAGSHAAYFQKGEYLAELELPFMASAQSFVDRLQKLWRRIFGQDDVPIESKWSDFAIFKVPFVDYARGDGIVIGPGQAKNWTEPGLLSPDPPLWVSQYRGLWGLFAHDPFSGEDAPAGPMYNRDGTVRPAWYDPLGWAGLDKVTPPNRLLYEIRHHREQLEDECLTLRDEIDRKQEKVAGFEVALEAMRGQPHLQKEEDAHILQLTAVTQEIQTLKNKAAANQTLAEAMDHYAERVAKGERVPVRAHINRPHHPATDAGLRRSRFAEAWAATSIGVLMVGFVVIALLATDYLLFGFTALLSVVIFVEASVRGNLTRLISSITTALAIVAALIVIYEFFWIILVVIVLIAGGYIIWENLRELRF